MTACRRASDPKGKPQDTVRVRSDLASASQFALAPFNSGLTLRASVALWLVFADVIVDQLLRADSNVGLMRLAERFGDQNVFEARLVQQAAEFFAAKELETALLLKLQQKSG